MPASGVTRLKRNLAASKGKMTAKGTQLPTKKMPKLVAGNNDGLSRTGYNKFLKSKAKPIVIKSSKK